VLADAVPISNAKASACIRTGVVEGVVMVKGASRRFVPIICQNIMVKA
jgi:hypothetical protein